ncbi:hypothetical protein LDC_0154, partial [sediment metagenome]
MARDVLFSAAMRRGSLHDSLFRRVFSNPHRAIELLRHLLPADLVKMIRWDAVELVRGDFVTRGLLQRRSDLLFVLPLRNRRAPCTCSSSTS